MSFSSSTYSMGDTWESLTKQPMKTYKEPCIRLALLASPAPTVENLGSGMQLLSHTSVCISCYDKPRQCRRYYTPCSFHKENTKKMITKSIIFQWLCNNVKNWIVGQSIVCQELVKLTVGTPWNSGRLRQQLIHFFTLSVNFWPPGPPQMMA